MDRHLHRLSFPPPPRLPVHPLHYPLVSLLVYPRHSQQRDFPVVHRPVWIDSDHDAEDEDNDEDEDEEVKEDEDGIGIVIGERPGISCR